MLRLHLKPFLLVACSLAAASLVHAQSTNWFAFNDHNLNMLPAPTTGPNVTLYHLGTGPGGPLTNQLTGEELSASLVISWTGGDGPDNFGASFDADAGTPAYNLFNGIVDVGGSGAGIDEGIPGLRGSEMNAISLTFSNLDASKKYVFRGTSVRGNNYNDRWSYFSIIGSDSYLDAHVDGSANQNIFTAATFAGGSLVAGEVAVNTGGNRVGSLVGWNDIVPASDGTFSILARQYVGPAPFGNPAAGPYGYALNAIMLAEIETGPPTAPAITTQPATVTVEEGKVAVLSVAATGTGPLMYQWYKGTPPSGVALAGATRSIFRATNIAGSGKTWSIPADSGQYYVIVTGAVAPPVTSTPATVTVTADTTPPAFVYAQCGATAEDIIIRLTEPLELDNGQGSLVTDQFSWAIQKVSGPGADPGQPATVMYTAGATTILMTAPLGSIDPASTYQVLLVADMVDRALVPNKLPADTSVAIECPQAISVGATGAGPYTFDRPPFAQEFSTFIWAGGANVGDTPASFDAKAQLLDATLITLPLGTGAGNPPGSAGTAQWASDGHYLITRPTGVEGSVILGRLRNDSGQTRTGLRISYALTAQFPVVEEVPGHLVYYSTSGAPNTWLQIPGISGDGTTGSKTFDLDLSATPWTVGSPLYLLWADDNGSGSPDDALEIDNFAVSFAGPKLTISYSSPSITITWTPANGILQFKDSITGAWTDVSPQPAAGGPYTIAASAAHRFYSLRQ